VKSLLGDGDIFEGLIDDFLNPRGAAFGGQIAQDLSLNGTALEKF
jgi:hypothetical protein